MNDVLTLFSKGIWIIVYNMSAQFYRLNPDDFFLQSWSSSRVTLATLYWDISVVCKFAWIKKKIGERWNKFYVSSIKKLICWIKYLFVHSLNIVNTVSVVTVYLKGKYLEYSHFDSIKKWDEFVRLLLI